jgi:hypothetical protein
MKMPSVTILTILVLLLTQNSEAQNPGDNIFSGTQVHSINLRFPRTDYWDSLLIYYNQGLEQYILAQAVIDGVTYDSIGVRFKGNSSFNHPNNKKSFRLAMDQYKSAQRWDGLKGVHLNNCFGDPTLMREKIHLDFCRDAGIIAPRGNYTKLYINDTLFAFYSLVEHVDKTFLDARFGNKSGDLFKAVDGIGDSDSLISDFKWYGTDTAQYLPRYELKTDGSITAWGKIIGFIDSLTHSNDAAFTLTKSFNLASYYRTLASDILFANLDSYLNSGRNFYAYFNGKTNLLEWIVWDAGLSFGGYGGGVASPEALSLTYVVNPDDRPLLSKMYGSAALKSDYLSALCHLYTEYFSTTKLFPHIDSVANIIRPFVSADARKQYTMQQFESNIVNDITVTGGGTTRKPGLKSFINLRQANIKTQLTALGVSCGGGLLPGEVVINEFMAQNDSIPDPAGEFADWIELYNPTSKDIDLAGLYLSDDASTPQKWQFPASTSITANGYLIIWADEDSAQAGIHTNFKLSAGGESLRLSNPDLSLLDSVSFGPQISNRSMARIPNGTGPFMQGAPTFNAFNTFKSTINIGDVVINEFAADNDSIKDPAGEAEDWIELYNNTNKEINLGGLYLSDSYSKPTKWQFPANTTIAPNGYFIVWADQDTLQTGLHALFALSKSGEAIILSNTDLSVLDSISFSAQATNLTMARIPNGTGLFRQGVPTFDAFNGTTPVDNPLSQSNSDGFLLEQNYPNPFRPFTTFRYQLAERCHVTLTVSDVLGREVAILVDRMEEEGVKSVRFDASEIPGGVYFYRLQAGTRSFTKNLILFR